MTGTDGLIEIRCLETITEDDVRNLQYGYISPGKYAVTKQETPERTILNIEYIILDHPYQKIWPVEDAPFDLYRQVIRLGYSFGAFDGEQMAGLIIVEPHRWNHSLWVWEFCIGHHIRGKGVGRKLMDHLAAIGHRDGFRAIVCEVQNTNVPAIRFYYKNGFEIDGVDLSYYTNTDAVDGEVAIFMKRKL